MSLLLVLLSVFAASAVVLGVVWSAYFWKTLQRCRIFEDRKRKVGGLELYVRVGGNMLLSSGTVVLIAYVFEGQLFRPDAGSPWLIVPHAAGILLLYDFFYYFLHRYAFHEWPLLRQVHVVHHKVRHPTAIDSLYLHPVETLLGVGLMMFSVWLCGPVGIPTFGLVFLVYSTFNILVHAGLNLPFFPFRALSFLARKHDVHHTSMKGGNYASLTPLFDILFGTAE